MKHLLVSAAFAALLIVAGRAHAAVTDSGPNGFTVTETVHVAAAPDKVWSALITPGNWWSSDHSFSHDARNMTLDAHAGGCWCETLPKGGSALFMTVVLVRPEEELVLHGVPGPLEVSGTTGALAFGLKATNGGTDISLTYQLGGYGAVGLNIFASAVDHVYGQQLTRLKFFIETGSPEATTK